MSKPSAMKNDEFDMQSRPRLEETHTAHSNRPGKPTISYRLATHSGFLRNMLRRLHLQKTRHYPKTLRSEMTDKEEDENATYPLRSLNSLSNDDPAIALLDAWAIVADVLTFYQERLANEGFIRTATERSSVLQLAWAVGYELLPGAAASCQLAFTVEEAVGSPLTVEIPIGMRVESIPEPGKLPLSFETVKPLTARAEWNILLPEHNQSQKVGDGMTGLLLQGANTQLQPGDILLFVGKERQLDPKSQAWQMRTLETVVPVLEQDKTGVTWSEPLEHLGTAEVQGKSGLKIFVMRERYASLFGNTAPDWRSLPEEMKKGYNEERWRSNWPDLGLKNVFGKYAIDLDSLYPRILRHSWIMLVDPNFEPHLCQVSLVCTINRSDYSLNARVTRVLPDFEPDLSKIDVRQTIVLAQSEMLQLAEVKRTLPPQGTVIELDRLVHGLSDRKVLIVSGKRMRAMVLAENLKFYHEEAKRALQPRDVLQVISAPEIDLKRQYQSKDPQLEWIMRDADGYTGLLQFSAADIQLQPAMERDEIVSEEVFLLSTTSNPERTTLILEKALSNFYDPRTMEIFANVVLATHGETVKEILGSGDGTRINQSFVLKKKPLTFTSARNSRGGESTLQVRVDGVLWDEASSLFDLNDSSRGYVLRIDENGTTKIVFGDGKCGARLPTGEENIVANYRSGLGPEGNVPAKSLSLLLNRPPGIRSVINPIAASGAASPESILLAKRNAPRTLMTLDRLVSLLDYESFAKSFVGIGKAKAKEILLEQGKIVHITISAQDGSQVDPNSELFQNLRRAIENRRKPVDCVQISGYRLLTFKIEASLAIDRHFNVQEIKKQSEAALRDRFSFSKRSLAQDVTASEILACLQKIEGVVYARLDSLQLAPSLDESEMQAVAVDENIPVKSMQERSSPILQCLEPAEMPSAQSDSEKSKQILRANAAYKCNGKIEPAELLLIHPARNGIKLEIKELKA